MRYLIDTHILIWFMEKKRRIPVRILTLLADPNIEVLISVVNVWEMVIKQQSGKLKVPKDIQGDIKKAGFKILPIEISHVLGIRNLSNIHKDPFDRILLAQAQEENLSFITADSKLAKYKIPGTILIN